MPTYTYRRQDDTTFEVVQKITEDALTRCPETDQPCHRIIVTVPPVRWMETAGKYKAAGPQFHGK